MFFVHEQSAFIVDTISAASSSNGSLLSQSVPFHITASTSAAASGPKIAPI